jgi:hypothetical protein
MYELMNEANMKIKRKKEGREIKGKEKTKKSSKGGRERTIS